VALHWEYNVTRKRWETSASGWRTIVARWANGTEWMAALESLRMLRRGVWANLPDEDRHRASRETKVQTNPEIYVYNAHY
jgi:hypothetical protein